MHEMLEEVQSEVEKGIAPTPPERRGVQRLLSEFP